MSCRLEPAPIPLHETISGLFCVLHNAGLTVLCHVLHFTWRHCYAVKCMCASVHVPKAKLTLLLMMQSPEARLRKSARGSARICHDA